MIMKMQNNGKLLIQPRLGFKIKTKLCTAKGYNDYASMGQKMLIFQWLLMSLVTPETNCKGCKPIIYGSDLVYHKSLIIYAW